MLSNHLSIKQDLLDALCIPVDNIMRYRLTQGAIESKNWKLRLRQNLVV